MQALLTEVERQDRYLAELPKNYNFPLFDGRLAIESQRKSGYKDTATAGREIVDNAVEAGAKNVWIIMDRAGEGQRGKHERRDAVMSIAFIDDGPGMRSKMIRAALAWGGGTHGKQPGRIGRFGFGLPNSSINQTQRVEVYSKTEDVKSWSMAALDIGPGKVPEHGIVTIDPEQEGVALPGFVEAYLNKKGKKLKSGTVVVWVRPDRLTYKKAGMLANLMREDFGATYRNLLSEFSLVVDDQPITTVDPLFLMKNALFYRAPDDGGAQCTFEKTLTVSYYRDEVTGAQHLDLLTTKEELAEARKDTNATIGSLQVRVARFPYGFALGGKKNPKLAIVDEHAKKRFAIRKPRRGMAILRGGREIDTIQVFPSEPGLGEWPLLQSYAYHWGVEVSFEATLDEAFGVGHDKQSVRPIEAFWRVLHEARVDEALEREQQWQREIRERTEVTAAEEELKNPDDSAAMQAAALAAEIVGPVRLPPSNKNDDVDTKEENARARERVQNNAKERAAAEHISEDEALEAIEREAEQRPFRIGYFETDGGPFFKPDYGNGLQVVAMVNKRHPFFETFYAPLVVSRNVRAIGALNLLLVGMAEYELKVGKSAKIVVEQLREGRLTEFLKVGLKQLDAIQPAPPHDAEGEEPEEGAAE